MRQTSLVVTPAILVWSLTGSLAAQPAADAAPTAGSSPASGAFPPAPEPAAAETPSADASAPAEPASAPPGSEPTPASTEVTPAPVAPEAAWSPSVAFQQTPWLKRYPLHGVSGEVGLFLGVLFPSKHHNFQNEFGDYQKLRTAALDLGLRASFLPIPYFGVEAEGALMPSSTEDGAGATIWSGRVHGLVQGPWRVAPFALLGGGRMGVLSDPLEDDADPLLHFGVGAKVLVGDRVFARLDFRDNLTQKNNASEGSLTHHPEVLLGITYRIPAVAPELAPVEKDGDGDGIPDPGDACPDLAGPAPDGCPALDADQDGFPDEADQCPDRRGVAPTGCPPVDTDGDGFFDDSDECPEQAGVAPAGCPPADTDGDGLADPYDECRDQPETTNGFEDGDGCPDELPDTVQQFTGVIQGIQFDSGKATLTPESHATLDQAVAVLNQYPELRIEIVGHTDNEGDRETNLQLSRDRAMSVKSYLVGRGIDEARIRTDGKGPDQPLVSNDTPQDRAKNRRIEFRLLP